MKKLILIVFYCLTGFSASFGQIDTEFWFAPPDVTAGHGESPIYIRLASLDEAAEVKFYIPALYDYAIYTYNLNANESRTIDLTSWINQLETYGNDQVQNTGIFIKSSAPISAYYEIGHFLNADIFALKGKNGLGNEFIIPSQTVLNNDRLYSFNPLPFSSFDIVATSNNTVVWVTPANDVVGHPQGETFIVKLNKGQTYSVTNVSSLSTNSLGGSVVKSNRPIAITLKEDSMQNEGCADVIGDQLVPIEVAGAEYVLMRGYLHTDEYTTITGITDNSEVEIHRGAEIEVVTIQKGEMHSIQITTPSTYIKANKPIYVIQVTGFGCEVGMAVIPSINCRGSRQIGFTRATYDFFAVNILVRKEGIDGFTLNGDPNVITSIDFSVVPGTNDLWYYAQKELTNDILPEATSGLLANSSNSFQVGIVHGDAGTSTKFGYFSAFSTLFIGDDMAICEGEAIILDAGPDKENYLWNTGSTDRQIIVTTPGQYIVRAQAGLCELIDTVNIEVKKANFNLPESTNICEGDTAKIDAFTNFSYLWGDGSTEQYLETTEAGWYEVEIIDYTGCEAKDSTEVVIFSYPEFTLGDDITKCPKDSVLLGVELNSASYKWNTGASSPVISVLDSAIYYVDITTNGCTTRDSIHINNYAAPTQDTIIGSAVVCPDTENVKYELDYNEGDEFTWLISGGNLNENVNKSSINWLSANDNAFIKVVVTNSNGCVGDTIKLPVNISEKLEPLLPIVPDTLCFNLAKSYPIITSNTSGSEYTWHSNAELISGQGTFEAIYDFPSPGIYQFYVDEHSVTQSSVCDGTSEVKKVLVFKDSASLTLDYVSVNQEELSVEINLLLENEHRFVNDYIQLFRKPIFEKTWQWYLNVDTNLNSILDNDADIDAFGYQYYLEAENLCGQQFQTLTHNSIILDGSSDSETDIITLDWNEYFGWPNRLIGYQVWRKLDNLDYELLFETTDVNFVGQIAADGFNHVIKVAAIRDDGVMSWSNEASFDFEHPVEIPNVITPNFDGVNDTFVIRKIELYNNSRLIIYNRFGKEVYSASSYNNSFDGADLASGTYYYHLSLKNGLDYSGILTILK